MHRTPRTPHSLVVSLGALAACLGAASVASAQVDSGSHRLSLASFGPEGALLNIEPSTVDHAIQQTFVLNDGSYTLETESLIDIRTNDQLGYRSRRFESILHAQFSEPIAVVGGYLAGGSHAWIKDPERFYEGDALYLDLAASPPPHQWSNTGLVSTETRDAFGSASLDVTQGQTTLTSHFVGSGRAIDPNSTSGQFADAYSDGEVSWVFTAPPGTILTLTWDATYNVLGSSGAPGSSVDDPILPDCPAPPFCFDSVCDSCWIDPPSTYGYRYETSDRLMTGVLGWSPHLDGPIRVSVESVDLGLFDPQGTLHFADHAQQLGSLLVGGIGVTSFSATEITPVTFASDPLAFPIRIDLDGPESTTMVMTPLSEPPTGIEAPLAPDWMGMEMTASPNPFHPSARISFTLGEPASV
ncbi:hypothetical protein K8I85_07050, partial [bacterium]|nr:hypothetical protein [bacterium]